MDYISQSIYIIQDMIAVSGDDDPVCPPADLENITTRVQQGRHLSLPGRHIVNIESAHAFNAALLEFSITRRQTLAATIVPIRFPATRAGISTRAGGVMRRLFWKFFVVVRLTLTAAIAFVALNLIFDFVPPKRYSHEILERTTLDAAAAILSTKGLDLADAFATATAIVRCRLPHCSHAFFRWPMLVK
ncbi:alpha/beta fold hydrolase [Rhizobium sullae]|nr:hypothetical protein [Rhizobium sullae]